VFPDLTAFKQSHGTAYSPAHSATERGAYLPTIFVAVGTAKLSAQRDALLAAKCKPLLPADLSPVLSAHSSPKLAPYSSAFNSAFWGADVATFHAAHCAAKRFSDGAAHCYTFSPTVHAANG
jgi:hypothetical protein